MSAVSLVASSICLLLYFSHLPGFIQADSLVANVDDGGEIKRYSLGDNVNLQCNTSLSPPYTLSWYKDDKLITSADKAHYEIVPEKNSLIVKQADVKDYGKYSCKLNSSQQDSDVQLSTDIILSMIPRVRHFKDAYPSLTRVEGSTLELECNFIAKPDPTAVTWLVGNMTLDEWLAGSSTTGDSNNTDRLSRTMRKPNEAGIEDAILIIDDLRLSDRTTFTCEVENAAGKKSATVLVRIRGKLAALWPFLGICAEVAILCAIIFIYERRRNKTDFEESDTDLGNDQKNTPDHGIRDASSDIIRQRK